MIHTMPDCSIIPVLAYEDLGSAISWLSEAFGFKERWRVGTHRAQLSFGDGAIAITEVHLPAEEAYQEAGERWWAKYSILVRVADVDGHYAKALEKGARILREPASHFYGERQYTVEDIGGHVWTFSQTISDMAPEDWGGVTAG